MVGLYNRILYRRATGMGGPPGGAGFWEKWATRKGGSAGWANYCDGRAIGMGKLLG